MSRSKRTKRPARRRSPWRYVLLACAALFIIGVGVAVGFIVAAVRGLPALSNLEPNPALTSFIYDVNGKLVADISGWENRVPVTLDKCPQTLIDAFIAAEDERFWTHHGIDLRGIARAIWRDVTSASAAEGASTITQQFARNAFGLGYSKTYTRKLQEVILAIQIERRYTKQEILEMYLNQIFFGHNCYGVQAASKFYFGKDVTDLNLQESALLCAIARNGNLYSPHIDAERALNRRNLVVQLMADQGKVSQADADAAKAADLGVQPIPPQNYPAAYFVDYVLEDLLDSYGADTVYRGGLKVYTTIDMDLQNNLEQAYKDILDKAVPMTDKDGNPIENPMQAASVFMEPQTGQIRAMVGGRNHQKQLELNRAVPPRGTWEGTLRQPGSSFKPIVDYAPAFELGWSPSNVLQDSVKTWNLPGQEPWAPENYNTLYRGMTSLRVAVEQSINTVAVKLLDQIGVETGVRYAKKFGITSLVTEGSLIDASLAVAIGGLTQGVSVVDMAAAFSVFDNGGIAVKPYAIIKVEDKYGNILEEHEPERQVVLSEQAAYLMTDVLKGVIIRGTGAAANPGRPAAGKTGTTDEDRDAWFVAYTPEIVGAMWMGHDQPEEMNDIFGGTYNAPIWKQTITNWLKDKPARDWSEPAGLVHATVCIKSGLLPGPACPAEDMREELFIQGRQPMAVCNVHTTALVCAQHPWELARPECPQTFVRSFLARPEPYEVFKKAEKNGRVYTYIPADANMDLPTQYCSLHDPNPPVYTEPTTEVIMSVWNYTFSPNTITVPLGTRVIIRASATDMNHGFALPAYGIDQILFAGQTQTITFVASQAGTFTWYSSVYSGTGTKTMTGTLTVTGG